MGGGVGGRKSKPISGGKMTETRPWKPLRKSLGGASPTKSLGGESSSFNRKYIVREDMAHHQFEGREYSWDGAGGLYDEERGVCARTKGGQNQIWKW